MQGPLLCGIVMDMNRKVLVVDDEKKIREMVSDYLTAIGFDTLLASNGSEAISMVAQEEPCLIVLDIMMPGIDGIDTVRRIRERSGVPIIMVTAKAEEGDKLIALEMGADDYLVKPFSLKELAARIRAILRRTERTELTESEESSDKPITVGDIVLDPDKMIVTRDGERLHFTSVQFGILKTLISNPGRVFSRVQLLNSFQEDVFDGYERTIDVHIKNIRKIIERIPSKPKYIETVWGVGYRFTEEI